MKYLNLAVISILAGLITNQAGAESIQRTMQMKTTAQLDKITLIDGQANTSLEQMLETNPVLQINVVYKLFNENDKGFVDYTLKSNSPGNVSSTQRLPIDYVRINRCGGIEVYAVKDTIPTDGGLRIALRIVSQSLLCGGAVPMNTSVSTLEYQKLNRGARDSVRYEITYKGSNLVNAN